MLRLALTSVAVAILVGSLWCGRAAAAAPPLAATTPPNRDFYIFDSLGAHLDATRALDQLRVWLDADGYHLVHEWVDPKEGFDPVDRHGITLKNLVSMAGAGIIILNTHGAGPKGWPGEEYPSTLGGEVAVHASRAYYEHILHWDPSWLDIGHATTPSGPEVALLLTPKGISHFFRGKHTGLIVASGCGSLAVARDFNAQAFFGYSGETSCSTNGAAGDFRTFFSRLAGKEGVTTRTTAAAFAAGGFSTGAELEGGSGPGLRGGVPLTLAPAVVRVTPPDRSVIGSGRVPVAVGFDTAMDERTPSQTVSASGCSATTSNFKWRTATILDFDLVTPKSAKNCRIRLTVEAGHARASANGSYPAELDGNQRPSPQNGEIPNGTDYVWTLSISKKLGSQTGWLYVTFQGSGHGQGQNSYSTVTLDAKWITLWKLPIKFDRGTVLPACIACSPYGLPYRTSASGTGSLTNSRNVSGNCSATLGPRHPPYYPPGMQWLVGPRTVRVETISPMEASGGFTQSPSTCVVDGGDFAEGTGDATSKTYSIAYLIAHPGRTLSTPVGASSSQSGSSGSQQVSWSGTVTLKYVPARRHGHPVTDRSSS